MRYRTVFYKIIFYWFCKKSDICSQNYTNQEVNTKSELLMK